jgi:hypothetical protein
MKDGEWRGAFTSYPDSTGRRESKVKVVGGRALVCNDAKVYNFRSEVCGEDRNISEEGRWRV